MTETLHPSPPTSAALSLAGKVALITGAAARIGAEIARALHAEGCDLLLHYRHSAKPAAALQAELQAARADSVQLIACDLNAENAIAQLEQATRAFRQRLDILVNNASSFYPSPLAQVTPSLWDDLMGSNLRAPFFLTQALAPLLTASGGCVVNLVDIHAERPLKTYPVYSIAKAGNAMMVKALARELGPAVRVNGIAPGAILWPEQGMDDTTKEQILQRTALQRPGSPRDIARTLLFLVRDAPYITGQILAVDGGRGLQQ
ncbi:3-oxoacyl-[acyl-carrier-protein] reductase FabG [Thiorhodovibrio winogradskyi]|uniref:3-oxoacyl-[acyl-carrier-protein] reductase FabG n=1 Tax=Thiorhodovibrio winogradskyi TaxID=77007 RepID=A0ABZ0SE80_9GAMM|nr:pteridine reductase [Thiorhodovibrio winogradskyi]